MKTTHVPLLTGPRRERARGRRSTRRQPAYAIRASARSVADRHPLAPGRVLARLAAASRSPALWYIADPMKASLHAALVLSLSSAYACSSSSGSGTQPCNENPWECPAGQTCWSTSTGAFECLNSGAGAAGGSCQNTAGIATCGDGLVCLQTSASGGTCAQYCDNTDPSHGCSGGLSCQTAELLAGGAEFHICAGASVGAGDDAGPSGGTDSGMSTEPTDSGALDSGVPDGEVVDGAAADTGGVDASGILVNRLTRTGF